jgi:hypothetical protein
MLRKELYRNNDVVVYGEPDRKKRYPTIRVNRSAIGNYDIDNNSSNYILAGQKEQPRLTTADGFTSGGNIAESIKPRMSTWGKRVPGDSLIDAEEKAKRREVIDDLSSNFKALKDNPSTYLVSYTETIPGQE